MLEILGAIGGIILVDLALSGDNALVIGAAAAGLPRQQQRMAILFGGAGAIVLRILLGSAATLLLVLPLLQAIGGVILLIVAVRLLASRKEHTSAADPAPTAGGAAPSSAAARGFFAALMTILVADVTMSLDNVLAVGALAAGNIPLLAGGLLLSMAILLLGSALVARLIGRLPWLLDVAALVLGWTAAHMIQSDDQLGPRLAGIPYIEVLLPAACLAFVLAVDILFRVLSARRARRKPIAATPREPSSIS
jgi:YjbE family integral membrane protein